MAVRPHKRRHEQSSFRAESVSPGCNVHRRRRRAERFAPGNPSFLDDRLASGPPQGSELQGGGLAVCRDASMAAFHGLVLRQDCETRKGPISGPPQFVSKPTVCETRRATHARFTICHLIPNLNGSSWEGGVACHDGARPSRESKEKCAQFLTLTPPVRNHPRTASPVSATTVEGFHPPGNCGLDSFVSPRDISAILLCERKSTATATNRPDSLGLRSRKPGGAWS